MCELMLNEWAKLRHTRMLGFVILGYVATPVLLLCAFLVSKESFMARDHYSARYYLEVLAQLFAFLMGPLAISVLSAYSITQEMDSGALKNLKASPRSAVAILGAKLLFLAVFNLLASLGVMLLSRVCLRLLHLNLQGSDAVNLASSLLLFAAASAVLIPLGMLLALLTRGFLAPVMLSIVGIIPNTMVFHWEHHYFSPWALSVNLICVQAGYLNTSLALPIASGLGYVAFFTLALLWTYRRYEC